MDFLLGDDFDFVIRDGDLAVCDEHEDRLIRARLILASTPGSWKEHPAIGVGAARLKDAPLTAELRSEIDRQLRSDGIVAGSIKLTQEGISIDL